MTPEDRVAAALADWAEAAKAALESEDPGAEMPVMDTYLAAAITAAVSEREAKWMAHVTRSVGPGAAKYIQDAIHAGRTL